MNLIAKITFSLGIIFLFIGCEKNEKKYIDTTYSKDKKIIGFTMISGKEKFYYKIEYYTTGQFRSIDRLASDSTEEIWLHFFSSGKIYHANFNTKNKSIQYEFDDKNKTNIFYSISTTGKIGNLTSSYKQGKCIEKKTDGRIIGVYNFNQNVQEGRQIEYYLNGKIKKFYIMKNGEIDGNYFIYDSLGNEVKLIKYKEGEVLN